MIGMESAEQSKVGCCKKRRTIWVAATAVVALIMAGFVLWPAEPEPTYQGKKLSHWLIPGPTFSTAMSGRTITWRTAPNRDALEHIGTNTLPFLLKWLHYETP